MIAALPLQSTVISLVAGIMEGSGIPFPGGILLTAVGAGTPTLPAAVLLATIFSAAYLIGSAAQYYLGAAFGPFMERLLPPALRERTRQVMERYGEAAVLWTRPLAVGNYVSIPAGMLRMPMGRFLLYTFVGIWPWAFVMTTAGTYLGAYFSPLVKWLTYGGLLLAVLAFVTGVHRIWLRIRAAGVSDQ